ncbi:hypothetical protein MNB_SV-6-1512 [hydrothermal vent metagenome]|uniref:Dynamin N-terminal domain-containing protein n=1 Tax=hydrothermal vent metagenome TaxID=652676 RepID=A0A1W1CEY3_9ZZZZ
MMQYVDEIEDRLEEMTKFFIFNREELKAEIDNMLKTVSSNIEIISDLQHQVKRKESEAKEKDEIIIRLEADHKDSLNETELKLYELREKFDFINSILSSKPSTHKDLLAFKMIIESDFFRISSIKLPSDEKHPVLQLEDIDRELQKIINYPQLNSKNIVTVVGETGCGKSSLLNNFLEVKDRDMPIGVKSTTPISTYIVADEEYSIKGQSYMGGDVDIHYQIYKKFTMEFLKSFKFDISKVLPFIIIKTPLIEEYCKNIAFVDTQGYNFTQSKRDTSDYIGDVDAYIWVVDISSDNILSPNTLKALKNLDQEGKPLYIVANKADLIDKKRLIPMLNEVKKILIEHDIEFEGVSAYSSVDQKESSFVNKSFLKFLKEQNKPILLQEDIILHIHDICDIYKDSIEDDLKKVNAIEKQYKLLELDMKEEGFEDTNGLVSLRLSNLKKLYSGDELNDNLKTVELLRNKMISHVNKIFGRDINI